MRGMRIHWLIALAALSPLALAQKQTQPPPVQQQVQTEADELMRLHWEKFSIQQNEVAKRCLLVREDGTFRYERATENMGGGGGAKAYEGKLPDADLAALKAMLTSPDFSGMQLPKPKRRSGTVSFSGDVEYLDYSSPVDEIPQVFIQSVDNDVPIPKQLRKLQEFFGRAEKSKPAVVKGPLQLCLPTERGIMRDEDPHRISTPPKP